MLLLCMLHFMLRACYKIENYVGRTFLNSKLCKELVALYNTYLTWTETKTRGILRKKRVFWESGYVTYIHCLKKWVCQKDMDKFLFILKIITHHDFISEFNPLSANPTKWPNTLKQFVGKLPTNCWVCMAILLILRFKG